MVLVPILSAVLCMCHQAYGPELNTTRNKLDEAVRGDSGELWFESSLLHRDQLSTINIIGATVVIERIETNKESSKWFCL